MEPNLKLTFIYNSRSNIKESYHRFTNIYGNIHTAYYNISRIELKNNLDFRKKTYPITGYFTLNEDDSIGWDYCSLRYDDNFKSFNMQSNAEDANIINHICSKIRYSRGDKYHTVAIYNKTEDVYENDANYVHLGIEDDPDIKCKYDIVLHINDYN